MVGKALCKRDRGKDHRQILNSSTPAQLYTALPNMEETAANTSGQNGSDNFLTEANPKSLDLNTYNSLGKARNMPSVHFHIRVLYTTVICLTVVLVLSLTLCYLEIHALKEVVSCQITTDGNVEFKIPIRRGPSEDMQMPYITPEDEFNLGGFWEGGELTENSESKTRSKRQTRFYEGSGDPDDWLWMSSFARVPIVALQSYCREAQLYCAAAGPPGVTGQKGDLGQKGEKGDFADESAIALSLANIEAVRGPPGPRGEMGPLGPVGPVGPPGEKGVQGVAGENGINGFPGPRGPKGDPGTRGLLGFPGIKGDPGPVGDPGPTGEVGPPGRDGNPGLNGAKGEMGHKGPLGDRGMSGLPGVPGLKGLHGDKGNAGVDGFPGLPGPKGEPGYCQVGCGETERTRTYIEVTTPTPTFPPRTKECSIDVVGVWVFKRAATTRQGAWMQDLKTTTNKVWITYGLEGNSFFEYSSVDNFKLDKGAKEIRLTASPYFGTGHVVYGGHFYYHWSGSPKIVRFDLTSGQVTAVRTIPDLVYTPNATLNGLGYLYQSQTMFVHFNGDQNGLWIVYANEKSEKITVALLNPENLDIIKSVTVDVGLGSKGGAFLACGKMYTLKLHTRLVSFLDEEHDLWLGTVKRLRIAFKNPYMDTSMLSYDSNTNHILSWDSGKLLSLPLLLKNT